MIKLKLTGVFEKSVHFKIIILKREDVFELNVQFKLIISQLSIQINYQILLFSGFQRTEVYSDPS